MGKAQLAHRASLYKYNYKFKNNTKKCIGELFNAIKIIVFNYLC